MSPTRAVLVVFVIAVIAAAAWFLKSSNDAAYDSANVGAATPEAHANAPAAPENLPAPAEDLANTSRAEVAGDAAMPGAAKNDLADAGKPIHAKITGRVVDEARRPVAGASVRVSFAWFPEDGGKIGTKVGDAKSGDDGRFALDVTRASERTTLLVSPQRHQIAKLDLPALTDGERDVGDIVTPLGGSVAGRIVDESGNAIEGANVSAWARGKASGGAGILMFGSPRDNERSDVTDARGAYQIDGLTPGEVTVLASKDSYTNESKRGVKVEAAGVTTDVSLTLGRGAEIRGVVVDSDGKPVPEATLSVMDTMIDLSESGFDASFDSNREVKSDANGAFVLSGLKGNSYQVTGRKDGYVTDTLRGIAAGTKDARITIARGGSIWGIVSDDATGKPVTDFKIEAEPARGNFGWYFDPHKTKVLTGEDAAKIAGVPVQPGLFAFAGLNTRAVSLGAEADGYTKTSVGPIDVAPTTTVRHDVALVPEITVSGVVRNPKGQPVADARVHVAPKTDDGETFVGANGDVKRSVHARRAVAVDDGGGTKVTLGDDNGKTAVTGADGHYVVRGLSEGKYTAKATHAEWAPSEATSIQLAAGERRDDVDLGVRAGGRLEGTAFDADGQTLAGARVTLSKAKEPGASKFDFPEMGPDDDARLSAVSDAKGHYEIQSVLPGDYRAELKNPEQRGGGAMMIFMADDGAEERGVAVTIHEGETTTTDLSLPPTGSVAGTVTEAGKPIVGVGVALKEDKEFSMFPIAHGTTNDRGQYELTGVDPGTYSLEVSPKNCAKPISRKVEIRARNVARENVTLPTGVIRGRVRDQDSHKGVEHVVVEVDPADRGDKDSDNPQQVRRTIGVFAVSTGSGGAATTMKFGNEKEQISTDADGNFEVRCMEPGDYTVTIRGGGVIQQKKEHVRIFEGKETDHVDFDAARGAIIRVKAVPADGKELMFVHATLVKADDPNNEEDRGEVGSAPVEFDGLAPGQYTVRVDSEGKKGELAIDVKSGDDRTVEVPIR